MALVLGVACAVFFAGMGIAAFANPAWVVGFFRIRAESAEGRVEVRAVYGGSGLAMSAAIAWAVTSGSPLGAGVLLGIAASVAGMAVGRIAGAVVDRAFPFKWVRVFLLVEIALAAALWTASAELAG